VTSEHILWLRVQQLDAVITDCHGTTTSGDLGAHEGEVGRAVVLLLISSLRDWIVECRSQTRKVSEATTCARASVQTLLGLVSGEIAQAFRGGQACAAVAVPRASCLFPGLFHIKPPTP
jgi:hypothetical protein